MKNELVLKLNHQLASGIQDEAAVVYGLTADAGEHEPAAIRTLVLKLVPPAIA
jgi:hypothetical protein